MGTIVTGIVVGSILAAIIYGMIKNKKRGKSCTGCSGNCGNCNGKCH